jgi:uncharacterized protein YlxP (DUF503 family)
MTIVVLQLELLFSGCPSTREKRRRMQAIMDQLHRHFNVALAEGGAPRDPNQGSLVAVAVGRVGRDVRETLERVLAAVAAYPRAELLSHSIREV